jgi:hypothetical protein
MKEAGVEIREPSLEEPELFHLRSDEIAADGRFIFAFVREPLSWYASQYSYRRMNQLRDFYGPGERIDDWMHTLDFPDFLNRMTVEGQDFLSDYYEQFVGPPDNEIDFVGRYENLVEDLVIALRLAGQEFNEPMLRRFDPINQTIDAPLLTDPDLVSRVMLSERRAYDRFYPWLISFWLKRSAAQSADWSAIADEYWARRFGRAAPESKPDVKGRVG